jgi:hypothetical protein
MPGKHNADGIEMSGGQPFPEGDYHLKVVKAEQGTIKSGPNAGCDKVTVDFQVVGGEHAGRTVNYHTVSFLAKNAKGAGMALQFLKAIGEPYEGEYTWDESRWIGRVCKAYVVIEPDQEGNKWNRAKWINPPDPEWADANAKAAKLAEEEIPF